MLEANPSVWSMLSFMKGMPKNAIIFGDPAEDVLMLNSRVKCSTPVETEEFKNCDPFTKAESHGMSDIMNRFAGFSVRLGAVVGAFTLAGESCGVGSCISMLDKKSFKMISSTSFHISTAGARRTDNHLE